VIYSQRVTLPARARWIDRVLGIAVGSLVTAWFLRREPEPVAVEAEATDPVMAPASAVRPTTAPIPVAVPTTGPVEATAPVPAVGVIAPVAARDAADASREPAEPRRATADATREAASADPPGDAPTLPLPRMPGDTRLSSSARFDAATDAWILKAAFRVHARDHHVLAFYRKALADQGLAVTESEDPPTADGAVKTYLHGKSARVHAQVGILPRTDALETRVWILWRSRG